MCPPRRTLLRLAASYRLGEDGKIYRFCADQTYRHVALAAEHPGLMFQAHAGVAGDIYLDELLPKSYHLPAYGGRIFSKPVIDTRIRVMTANALDPWNNIADHR
ncbi:hypothetical protein R1flu_011781 [Riccia fluitans]|uniref:Uncharacterized protein n=1 Tax=Riccia fluitans TaxID=41844 RepID=A0ABD1ZBB3_9MARC